MAKTRKLKLIISGLNTRIIGLISIISCLLFIFNACRTEVPHEFPNYKQTPVLNSVFTADSTIWIHVSYASKMEETPISEITNAQVYIFKNAVCIDTLKHTENGLYLSDSIVDAGNKYTAKVYVPGFDTVIASQFVPQPSAILKTTFIPLITRNEEGHVAGFDIEIQNTIGETAYYMLRAYGYSSGFYREIQTNFSKTDPSYIAEGIPFGGISNSLFLNDSSFTIQLSFQQGRYYDVFQLYQIELHTISADFYEYIRSSYIYEQSRYPEFSFTGVPPYNLHSNTSNKIGVFMSESIVITDTTRIRNNLSALAQF